LPEQGSFFTWLLDDRWVDMVPPFLLSNLFEEKIMAGTGTDPDSITIPSRPEKISEVDDFLEGWLRKRGVAENTIADLAIAITELVNNAINHGNKQKEDKRVTLTLRYCEGEVEASITDEGEGFDPDDIPDPLAEENLLKEIGRGIFIVKSLMDGFSYKFQSGGGTTVSIVKKIA
jgi:serine/threonine-protein kinase RsbW